MNEPLERASQGQVFGPVLVPALNVTKNSWTPVYPDWIDPRRMAVAAIPAVFFVAVLVAPAPTYAAAQYPDWIPPRIPNQTLLLGAGTPVAEQVYGQAAYYPDRIDRHLPDYQGWFAQPTLDQPVPRYAWRPTYPEWIPPARALDEGWYVKPVDAPDVTRFQWRGYQPDWFPERRATQPAAVVLDPFPRPDVVQVYGQAAYYPDWLPPARAQDPGGFVGPVQNPQLVPLSWAPIYPDRVLQREFLPEGWFVLGRPVVAPVIYWTPVYPDWIAVRPTIQPPASQLPPFPLVSFGWFVPPPHLPGRIVIPDPGWFVRPLREPDDIARSGWKGYQPDWLRHLTPVLTPYLVVDPFPRPPVAPTYGYVAVYPDWIPPRTPVQVGLFATIIDPIPPPEGAFGNEVVGLAPKRTFTTEGIQLGGGGPFG